MLFKPDEERGIEQGSSLLVTNPVVMPKLSTKNVQSYPDVQSIPNSNNFILSENKSCPRILPRPALSNINNSSVNLTKSTNFHERFINYMKARNRIFSETSKSSIASQKLKRLQNFRKISKLKKSADKYISSFDRIRLSDDRPYAKIILAGIEMEGLLDSGASISALGKDSLEFLTQNKISLIKMNSCVTTSDGTRQDIFGFVILKVNFKNLIKEHRFFVIPSLKQKLYLGYDFFRAFNVASDLMENCYHHSTEACIPNLSELSPNDLSVDPNQHLLTRQQEIELKRIKSKFPSSVEMGLGRTHLLKHFIDTGGAEPIKCRHYPVSPNVQQLMYQELDRMLSLGVIEEAESPWNFPVVLVRKPGKNRLCLDSRRLNNVTKKMAYGLPNINGLLSRLSDTHFISSIDLKDAFWQIELKTSSRERTAFTVPGRPQYQFKVMPFGLCNAAQRLCQLMDRIFPSSWSERVFTYLDDLLVVSRSFNEHMRLLSEVAERLRNAGLTVNLTKSRFCCKEVKYLGHIVGNGSIRPDPDKISAITNFPVPCSVKQVRRFIGMCGYYSKFVKGYSSLSAPITDTIKKHGKFNFPENALLSFHKLKNALVQEPILVHPDFEQPFFVHCDASSYGVGACLMQKDSNGQDRAICFFSKKLTGSQKNYSITELECLAVVLAVEKFRPYIELHEFTVITDHSALKWLMGQKDLSGRLARWSLRLQRYNFSIEHRKGVQNVVPDCLSRESDISEINNTMKLVDLNSEHFDSDEYKSLRETVQQNQSRLPDVKVGEKYVYKRVMHRLGQDDEEFDVWRLWIPSALTHDLVFQAHCSSDGLHNGIAKTIHKLRQLYFWPRLGSQVKSFVENCEKCKSTKNSNIILRHPMGQVFVTQRPFQQIFVDYLGPYPRTAAGFTYIFVILDHLTKYPIFIPLRNATTQLTIEALEKQVFCMFNVPENLFSDRGSQFMSSDFQKFLKLYGVKHLPTPTHSPQSNASERLNQSIIQGIRLQIDSNHKQWDKGLTNIAFALRSSIHSSIGVSPHFALFGHDMICHGSSYNLLRKLDCLKEGNMMIMDKADRMRITYDDIMDRIQEVHERNERRYNLRSRQRKISVGQIVYRRLFHLSNKDKHFNAKFAPKFSKCKVREILGNSRFLLEDLDGKVVGTYHSKDLKL